MYKSKKVLAILAVFVFSSASIFAQSGGSATTNVKIQLKKGLSISNVTGNDLDFGENVILATEQIIPAAEHIRFLVSGQAGATIDLDFPEKVTLDDGGSNSLEFSSLVEETGETPGYSATGALAFGITSQTLGATGLLNLWLGGSIKVPVSAVSGSYSGTFTIAVAYN